MPKLAHTPTVGEFASAWTAQFAAAVRGAGGRDGRLSRNEAAKIAQGKGALASWGDNAVNYLERTGQKSVSIDKLIGKGRRYAEAYDVAAVFDHPSPMSFLPFVGRSLQVRLRAAEELRKAGLVRELQSRIDRLQGGN